MGRDTGQSVRTLLATDKGPCRSFSFSFLFFFFFLCFASSQHAFAPHTPDLRKMCFMAAGFCSSLFSKGKWAAPEQQARFLSPSPLRWRILTLASVIVYLRMKPETRAALQSGNLSPSLDLLKRFISNPEERVRFKVRARVRVFVSVWVRLSVSCLEKAVE
jgi:hypothetical protein